MPSYFVYNRESTTRTGACKKAEGIFMGWLKELAPEGLTRSAVRDRFVQLSSQARGSKQDPDRLANYLIDSLKRRGAIVMRVASEPVLTSQQEMVEANTAANAELQAVKADLQAAQGKLWISEAKLQVVQDELKVSEGKLQVSEGLLEATETKLWASEAGMEASLEAAQAGMEAAQAGMEAAQAGLQSTILRLEATCAELEASKETSDDFEIAMYKAQAATMGLEDDLQSSLAYTEQLEDDLKELRAETNVMRGLFLMSFSGLVATGLYIAAAMYPQQSQFLIGY